MPIGKELPQTQGDCWWKNKDGSLSSRLKVEMLAISSLFDTKRKSPLALPESEDHFDVKGIAIITKNLTLEKFEEQSNYCGKKIDIGWLARFSMEDGNHLCSSQETWNILMLFRKDYPFYQPLVAIYDIHGKWLTDDHHRGIIKVELFWNKWKMGDDVYNPPIICHCSPTFHIPGFTQSGQHALQSILWLRSNLDRQKNNRSRMLKYE